ncbi:MFS transporter [Streptomyces sp. NPDC058001]|uniref:MFS transporter n=1 Tax=Streptomyces sp. NPDC058001 TaxID=3346300 RepID=UPI0036E3FB19
MSRGSARDLADSGSDIVAVFVRWTWSRAMLHNGWWLVTSVYLVVDARLSAAELVWVGALQGITGLVCEVPAGVVADTISRKWSLVVSHVLMGTAMVATALVTDFWAVAATQMLWGLSWTFASGSDVAWVTDELADPERTPGVLVRAGRAQLTGSAAGMTVLGLLATVTDRRTAMVAAGGAMLLLGGYVVYRFREERFVPTRTDRWSASWAIVRRGSALVRGSRVILIVFAATFLVNGAADAFARLYPQRLFAAGFPSEPLLWFTALGVVTLVVGAGALRVVEARVHEGRAARRGYVWACAAGAFGLAVLAVAPDGVTASAAVLLIAGTALPLTRTIGMIWVNQRTTGDVRATVHSFLAQAEYLGEILCGAVLAGVAAAAGLPYALACCGVLFAVTAYLIGRPAPAETTGK